MPRGGFKIKKPNPWYEKSLRTHTIANKYDIEKSKLNLISGRFNTNGTKDVGTRARGGSMDSREFKPFLDGKEG